MISLGSRVVGVSRMRSRRNWLSRLVPVITMFAHPKKLSAT